MARRKKELNVYDGEITMEMADIISIIEEEHPLDLLKRIATLMFMYEVKPEDGISPSNVEGVTVTKKMAEEIYPTM